jgi:MFS family permease
VTRSTRARIAVSVVFAVHGAVAGSFATRIPWIVEQLRIGPGGLGLALLMPSIGAIIAMPLAGRLSHRYDGRTLTRVLLLCWTLALALPAAAPDLPALGAMLLLYGATAGMTDVSMNAQGVLVEERYGRSIMSGLHGMWSVGGIVGSAAGALVARAGTDARLHLGVAALVLSAIGWLACRGLLPERAHGAPAPAYAWPPRAVLLIGLVGFCAIFAEVASADWSAVYLRSITSASAGVAAASVTGFAATMAAGRLAGDRLVRRFGAVRTVRWSGVIGTVGALLVVVARTPALAILGFALIGIGIAVVVPLAFAAAGTSSGNPTRAIAGVATVAYGAGLAAPSTIGAVAQLTSLSVSFIMVAALTAVVAVGAVTLRSAQSAAVLAGGGDGHPEADHREPSRPADHFEAARGPGEP